MIFSTGDIKESYTTLDVVMAADFSTSTKKFMGMKINNGVNPLENCFEKVNERLIFFAESVNADGVIHIKYETHLINNDEIFITAYGTLIKLNEE